MFSDIEKKSIKSVDIDIGYWDTYYGKYVTAETLRNQFLYPISYQEAFQLRDAAGPDDYKDRDNSILLGKMKPWSNWNIMRSCYYHQRTGYQGMVFVGSTPFIWNHNYEAIVRPLFNLDTSKIYMVSGYESDYIFGRGGIRQFVTNFDGKKAGYANQNGLKAVPAYSGNSWKITFQDETREIKFTTVSDDPQHYTLNYSGAVTGDNEYISGYLYDTQENLLYYGRLLSLADASKSSGTVEVIIPEGLSLDENAVLYLTNEQYNTYGQTDLVGQMVRVMPCTVPVTIHLPDGSVIEKTGYHGRQLPSVASNEICEKSGFIFEGYADASGKKWYDAEGNGLVLGRDVDSLDLTPVWTEIPVTGDSFRPAVLAAMLALSLAAVLLLKRKIQAEK